MAEERGFEVVDRRHIKEEAGSEPGAEPGAADAETAAPTEGGGTSEEELRALLEDLPGGMPQMEISVRGILQMTVGMLSECAWVAMGLHADPVTGKMRRDLNEARRAIDVAADLCRHLEGDASPEERRELQLLVSNLRLNFVRQQGG